MNKKINTLYAVIAITDSEETIAAINMSGLNMQAVTSKKVIAEMTLKRLQELVPSQKLVIKEFIARDILSNDQTENSDKINHKNCMYDGIKNLYSCEE